MTDHNESAAGDHEMVIIGLTGSIGMGKSTAGRMLQEMGAPLHDSDAAVHELLGAGGAGVAPVAALFPQAFDTQSGAIDRKALGRIVFADPQKRRALEEILHPLVVQSQYRFIEAQRARGAAAVVLDIPLLFETGADKRVDVTMVVSAPEEVQRARVMARAGMTAEKFEAIKASQMPDAEKRKRSDFVIDSGVDFEAMRAEIARTLQTIMNRERKNDSGGFPSRER